MKNLLLIFTFFSNFALWSQLPNGSQAPDFTLIDIVDSNSYNLYDYLNDGKTVFIEIFAAHCPSCWNYHSTERLNNMYTLYGPNGTDEIMIFALEYDQWNFWDAFIGVGPAWVTQGDWIAGTPYPIFNVEDGDRSIFTDYNVNYYPMIYKICPGGETELISTSLNETQLYQKVQDCIANLSIDELNDAGNIYFNNLEKALILEKHENIQSIQVLSLQGQIIAEINSVTSDRIPVNISKTGIYLFQINTEFGPIRKKFFVN